MRFVLKLNVRAQLMLAILLAIIVSWVVSNAIANYSTYVQISDFRRQMLAHPEIYPQVIPQPRFGPRELLLGLPRRLDPTPPPRDNPPRQSSPFPVARNNGAENDNGSMPLPDEMNGNLPQPPPEQAGMPDNPPPNENGMSDNPPPRGAWQAGPNTRRHPPRNQINPSIGIASLIVIALLLAFVTSAWLSRRFTRSLAELTHGARAFIAGKFTHRIPVDGEDEFAQVATAMNELADRVSAQIADLEEDAQRRRQLLADVAHELRTPVTTMRTMAGALEEGLADDPERHRRAINSLVRTSDRLQHLVTDLLQLAKLDLHELPLLKQPVDVRALADSCVEAHTEAAHEAGVRLQPVEAGPPCMVNADADRLAQVLDNLLNNAISYAGSDVDVRVVIECGDPTRIIVADTGQGISPRHLPYLFDPFYRADAVRSPRDQHSGLGLRIARGIIETHGGTLTLESREGHGTQAIITLPALP